ncbi:lipopolysaccharide-induced tumor necrosis factor-alpha factor homolog isoform X2 [Stigmatopora nigra]
MLLLAEKDTLLRKNLHQERRLSPPGDKNYRLVKMNQYGVPMNPVVGQPPPVMFHPSLGTVPVVHIAEPRPGNTCPACGVAGMPKEERAIGVMTWVVAGALFVFGLVPCAFIPFCVDSCKDVKYRCASCSHVLRIEKQI